MREIEPKLRGIVDPYLLGVHLEIPTEDLEQFRANYPGNVAQQRIDVINYWLNNSKDITWEALARAVEEMGGHKNLVTTLKKLAKGSVASQQELSVTGSDSFSLLVIWYRCMLSNFNKECYDKRYIRPGKLNSLFIVTARMEF